MDGGILRQVRFLLDGGKPPQSFVKQPRRVDVFIGGQIGREFRDPFAQLPQRSHAIAPAVVIEGDGEVDDRLQEVLAVARLFEPDILQHIVTFKEPSRVEVRDALFESGLHYSVCTFMVARRATRPPGIRVLDSEIAVWNWFRRKPTEEPLTGARPGARMKSYSAMSGYVYQYVFIGQRAARRERRGGMEYAFAVCHDRKTHHQVWVFVADESVAAWSADNGRELTNSERYGVAKMALRNAFDERTPANILEPIAPGPEDVRAILEELDV